MSTARKYYHTCPDCKANLDPGERCDCQRDEQKSCSTCAGNDDPAGCPPFCGDNGLSYSAWTPKKRKSA